MPLPQGDRTEIIGYPFLNDCRVPVMNPAMHQKSLTV